MVYSRFLELCAEKKQAPSSVATTLGFSKNAFSRWKETAEENNGFASLRADTLMKLADYFDVSTDYLCGKSDRRDQSSIASELARNPRKMLLFDETEGLSDKSLEQVIRMVRMIKGLQDD